MVEYTRLSTNTARKIQRFQIISSRQYTIYLFELAENTVESTKIQCISIKSIMILKRSYSSQFLSQTERKIKLNLFVIYTTSHAAALLYT